MKKLDLSLETISNASFVLVGLLIFSHEWWLGTATILLGLGSGYSHATKIWWPDWLAMWIAFSAVLFLGLSPIYSITLGIVLFYAEQHVRKLPRLFTLRPEWVLLGMLFFAGAIKVGFYLGARTAVVYTLMYILAFSWRQGSHEEGHSIWHIFAALGLLTLIN